MTLLWRTLDVAPVSSLSEYISLGGGVALREASQGSGVAIINEIADAKLRGRGGAGFPTAVKFGTVADSRSDEIGTTVVVNAAEGEPGTFKDRALLRTNPYRILEGALVAAMAVDAVGIKVGIKATFHREIQRLHSAISELSEARWLDDFNIEIVGGPSSYLFGEETGLLEVLEGRQPFPRVTPPFRRGLEEHDTRSAGGVHLAAAGGSDQPPALVDNVETLANVALILANGADWFREVGTADSPGTIVCTVTGATRRHGVGEVPMGTTLREAIHQIGWGPLPDRPISLVVSGTANALIPASLLDTPLSYEAMREVGTGLGSAGFIVFDDRTDPVAVAQGISRFLSVESCGQCEPCKRDGLAIAAGLNDLARSVITERELAAIRSRVGTVAIGARCNLASQQAEVVGSMLSLFEDAVDDHMLGRRRPAEKVLITPIANIVGGRAVPDETQLQKQPDWSYNAFDSGAFPAARLGDTSVYLEVADAVESWPEWTPLFGSNRHPLAMLDEAHEMLEQLLHESVVADLSDRPAALSKLSHIIHVHMDVTSRVLFPIARRYGSGAAEELADVDEDHETLLLNALSAVLAADANSWSYAVDCLAQALRDHSDYERELVEALRDSMDPDQREALADALAEARMTSTLSVGGGAR